MVDLNVRARRSHRPRAFGEKMHICFACDDEYARHLKPVVRSIGVRATHGNRRVTIMSDSLSQANKDELAGLCEMFGIEVAIIEIGNILPASLPESGYLTRATFARLFATEIIAAPKLLYLDVDTICASALEPLWDVELEGAAALMVEASWDRYIDHKTKLGLVAREAYFNTGVMLMDQVKLRKLRFFEQALSLLAGDRSRFEFGDQDIINVILRGEVRSLHPRWNVTTALFDWRPGNTVTYAEVEVFQALQDPAIIHYTGKHKPWHPACPHPYAEIARSFAR